MIEVWRQEEWSVEHRNVQVPQGTEALNKRIPKGLRQLIGHTS